MAVFDNWPYVDFHQLNLDWIIRFVKEYLAKVDKLEIDFKDLHDYVYNYFDSVDFAQLVNDKIDEMFANGDFNTLFATYTTRVYNTVAEMKADTMLIDGSHAHTMGYYAAGDGGAADYIIQTITPSVWYEVTVNGLNAALVTNGEANIMEYGCVDDGVFDNTTRIQAALNENMIVNIPDGSFASQALNVPQGVTVNSKGELIALSTPLLTLDSNTTINGGYFSTALANATCIDSDNETDILIRDCNISGFKNKGIAFTGVTYSTIDNVIVSGADGTTGGAISIGGTSSYNSIVNCYLESSRIGLIFQSSYLNNASNISVKDCPTMGICFDGTISGSGDGAYENTLSNFVITGQTSSTYGGVYFGNGAHSNVISDFNIHNCARGIKATGASANPPIKNRITNGSISTCSSSGIQLSYGSYTNINNVIVDTCVTGIDLLYSDSCVISNCTIMGNTSRGVKIMSGYCNVIANQIRNNGEGVFMGYGGSSPTANSMFNNTFGGNTTDSNLSGSPTVANNVNYTP